MGSPKIGIALGSGSARGWAHIGVLKALESQGVSPDIVCGSSIGAVVGAAYVTGTLDRLELGVRALNWPGILSYMDVQFNAGGLIQGDKLLAFVREKIGEHDICQNKKAFGAVATDLKTGQEVWLRDGSLLEAVRASIALPGLLSPYNYQGRWLLDGGLVNPVPVSLCRAMGADIVIAVNLNGDIVGKHFRDEQPMLTDDAKQSEDLIAKVASYLGEAMKAKAESFFAKPGASKAGVPGIFDVMASAINIMQDQITRSRMADDPPDIMLSPRLSYMGLFEFDRGQEAIVAGKQEVARLKSEITALLNNGHRTSL